MDFLRTAKLRSELLNMNKKNASSQDVASVEKTSSPTQPKGVALSGEVSSVPSRPNPLTPPNEAELLFILPSLSLRVTTNQRQTMSRPSLSSLPPVRPPPPSKTEVPQATNTEQSEAVVVVVPTTQELNPTKKSRVRFSLSRSKSPCRAADNAADIHRSGSTSTNLDKYRAAPIVNISFEIDFRGFVQLGLIDVPWLPTLISSYLNENLQEYERESCPAKYTLHIAIQRVQLG